MMIFDVGWRDVAVALAMLLLAGPSTAHASRDCLDFAQATRSWQTPTLAMDNEPFVSAVQLALFVSLVLATMSVIEVARTRHGMNARRRRWSSRQSRG